VARCRDGTGRADREILRVSENRAGFAALDAWLERQPEPVVLVTMESSGPLLDADRRAPASTAGPYDLGIETLIGAMASSATGRLPHPGVSRRR